MCTIAISLKKIPAAIERYQNEVSRLYEVLDKRLEHNVYLAGDFSISDIANWCFARIHGWAGVSVDEFEYLQRWLAAIEARHACGKGVDVPFPASFSEGDKFVKDVGAIVGR